MLLNPDSGLLYLCGGSYAKNVCVALGGIYLHLLQDGVEIRAE